MRNILNKILDIQQRYPNIYVGGSIALMLQGTIPFRNPKDVDLISPYKIHIYEVFNVSKEKHSRIRHKSIDDIRFELFFNPKAEYIEFDYNDSIIKLSPSVEIMEWKINKLSKYSNSCFDKHIKDLQYYIL